MIATLTPALRLVAIAALVASAIAWVARLTEPAIALNRAATARAELATLLGVPALPAQIDVRLLSGDDVDLCDARVPPTRIVRGHARGYAGDIEFVMAIGADARLVGVRVNRHQETPGLGDFIEADRSDWTRAFVGLPAIPDASIWSGTPRAGIDAVSGATITSRGLVDGVHATLAALSTVTPCLR